MVETTKPVNESAAYGTACRRMDRRPACAQTHRLLSSKEGIVPIAVATTFDQVAGQASTPTSTPSTLRAVTVEMADTALYRTKRPIAARREAEGSVRMRASIGNAAVRGPRSASSSPEIHERGGSPADQATGLSFSHNLMPPSMPAVFSMIVMRSSAAPRSSRFILRAFPPPI